MKNLLSMFAYPRLMIAIFLTVCLFSPDAFSGGIKRSGATAQHNYNYYNYWQCTGTVGACGKSVSTASDTVYLLKDSASTTYFTTANLRHRSADNPANYDLIPDTLSFCLIYKGDAQDAATPKLTLQYQQYGGVWINKAADVSLTATGADTLWNFACTNWGFEPGLPYRIGYFTSTATDTSRFLFGKAWAH